MNEPAGRGLPRLFRLFLCVYPARFREERGEELLDFWRAQAAEGRYRGVSGRLRLLLAVGSDALAGGLRSRWTQGREEGMTMRSMWMDTRYAIRSLAGAPLFAATAVVTLGLGIGATTAVYSIVDGVVLRPLPYPEPERLVMVLRSDVEGETEEVSWPDFRDWREQADGFRGMAATTEAGRTFVWEDGAESLDGALVTRDYFDVMGVPLHLGRTFTEQEDLAGGPGAIILSYGVWVDRFGADPEVLGRVVPIESGSVPIVGVASEGFAAPNDDTRFWMPLKEDQLLAEVGLPTGTRTLSFLDVVGRLAPEADATATEARLREVARAIDESVGKSPEQVSNVTLRRMIDEKVGDVRGTLFLLLGAAALVLVVATANVAGLAFTRAAFRSRELALRTALGAPRRRLLRQLLAEGGLLAIVAGALGLALAWATQATILHLAPPGLPRASTVSIGATTIAFAVAATTVTGALFGLIPGLRASRVHPVRALTGGRTATDGRRAQRPQQILVTFQIAVAVTLLVGAALLTASFRHLLGVERGFDSDAVLVATVAPSSTKYDTPERIEALYADILDRVRALPGVSTVSTTYSPPLFQNDFRTSITPEGAEEDRANRLWAGTVIVSPGYFETNGVALTAGRDFDGRDRLDAPPVVIVNEALAHRLWPTEDPLGKRIVFTGALQGTADSFDRAFFPHEPMTVVGVAADVRRERLDVAPQPEYYRPHSQITWGFQYLLVKAGGDPAGVAAHIRDAVWAVDASIPVKEVRTLDDQVSVSVAPERFRMLVLLTFGGLASLLAMVGLYAVMSLAVARRVREMGIRLALGASRAEVSRAVLARGSRLIVVGAALGLLASAASSRLLSAFGSGLLFEVRPVDPPTYALVALLVGAVGMLACWVPARRAGSVDPVVSLQEE